MDGNGRWAEKRGLVRTEGHRQGLSAARRLVESAAAEGIAYLTLFAFSNENWRRPDAEVSALLRLFADAIASEDALLRRHQVELRFIGDLQRFPSSLRTGMASLQNLTRGGKRLVLTLALGYSGRWDILQAAERLAASGDAYSEENFSRYLATAALPPPDLLIRTGGETRISNFMLWQAAYTELYFTPTLWPDFSAGDLQAAMADFYRRERRFGGVSGAGNAGEQVETEGNKHAG